METCHIHGNPLQVMYRLLGDKHSETLKMQRGGRRISKINPQRPLERLCHRRQNSIMTSQRDERDDANPKEI